MAKGKSKKITLDHLNEDGVSNKTKTALLDLANQMDEATQDFAAQAKQLETSMDNLGANMDNIGDRMSNLTSRVSALGTKIAHDRQVMNGRPREYHGGVGERSSSGDKPGLRRYSR